MIVVLGFRRMCLWPIYLFGVSNENEWKVCWSELVAQSANSPTWLYWTGDSFRPSSCEAMSDLRLWHSVSSKSAGQVSFNWKWELSLSRDPVFQRYWSSLLDKNKHSANKSHQLESRQRREFCVKSEQAGSVGSISELYSAGVRFGVVPDTDILDTFSSWILDPCRWDR